MKKVTYGFGCRALGYSEGEFYVDESTSDSEIYKKLDDMAEFETWFSTEDGYEPEQEVVYRKVR